jgi:hypothetical protein
VKSDFSRADRATGNSFRSAVPSKIGIIIFLGCQNISWLPILLRSWSLPLYFWQRRRLKTSSYSLATLAAHSSHIDSMRPYLMVPLNASSMGVPNQHHLHQCQILVLKENRAHNCGLWLQRNTNKTGAQTAQLTLLAESLAGRF